MALDGLLRFLGALRKLLVAGLFGGLETASGLSGARLGSNLGLVGLWVGEGAGGGCDGEEDEANWRLSAVGMVSSDEGGTSEVGGRWVGLLLAVGQAGLLWWARVLEALLLRELEWVSEALLDAELSGGCSEAGGLGCWSLFEAGAELLLVLLLLLLGVFRSLAAFARSRSMRR